MICALYFICQYESLTKASLSKENSLLQENLAISEAKCHIAGRLIDHGTFKGVYTVEEFSGTEIHHVLHFKWRQEVLKTWQRRINEKTTLVYSKTWKNVLLKTINAND
jgi:hypothetical protein